MAARQLLAAHHPMSEPMLAVGAVTSPEARGAAPVTAIGGLGSAVARDATRQTAPAPVAAATAPRPRCGDPVLVVDELAKHYRSLARREGVLPRVRRVVALAGMSFDVAPGEIVGLLGPNGSGKTTAMKIALGLARADGGACSVLGAPVPAGLPAVIGGVGAMIEMPRFTPRLTARQTLALLGRVQRIGRSRVDACLELVGLDGVADRAVGGFSLGMRQRLSLAAALLRAPALLLLDEPANGLDPAGVHQLRAVLRTFADEGGAVLLSSHVLAEVQRLADRAVVVARGRTLASGTLDELAGTPRWLVRVAEPDRDLAAILGPRFTVRHEGGGCEVSGPAPVTDLSRRLTAAGCTIVELTPRADLEQRYLELVAAANAGGRDARARDARRRDAGAKDAGARDEGANGEAGRKRPDRPSARPAGAPRGGTGGADANRGGEDGRRGGSGVSGHGSWGS